MGKRAAALFIAAARARFAAVRIATGPSTVRQIRYTKRYAPLADRLSGEWDD